MYPSPKLQKWRQNGKYMNYKDNLIFYKEEKGDGQLDTILFIHGFPTNSFDWNKIWDELKAKAKRVICFDQLGYGFSDKPIRNRFEEGKENNDTYNFFEQATITEALLEHLGVKEVNIFAHDYGDTTAQELLTRFENKETKFKISSICWLNGGFLQNHNLMLIQKVLLNPYTGPYTYIFNLKSSFFVSMRKTFGSKTQPTEQELEDMFSVISFNHGFKTLHNLNQYHHERKIFHKRWISSIKSTNVKLLHINGPSDPISGKVVALKFKRIIEKYNKTNSKMILMDDHIGHWPQLEHPSFVVKEYLKFLSQ
eukprot:TRINITY_DN6861_c0_g1_i2.p1 TRINITY_DN6861_c0_g1~~TRINITY_DN6861_c0_g1_i2.p1  ORF type:complete len:335 (-),score=75.56 TRINITY_DN6861_c0_g1_i2:75-1004(-)